MKKYLPIIFLLVGVLVLAGVFLFVKGRAKDTEDVDEDEVVKELPFDQRPFTSLTPSDDGHWLTLKIENIVVDAASFDYELLYKLPDGRTQGVPGTIKLEGQSEIERELLLGSESSGKFRYDEGVENGTLTLRFRNEKGKLVAKLLTDFHLQDSQASKFTSVDGEFTYKPKSTLSESGYFVTMQTFGVPGGGELGQLKNGPYGVFSSLSLIGEGMVDMQGSGDLYHWDGEWSMLENDTSSGIGIFVKTSG